MKTIILKIVSPFKQILTNSVGRKPAAAKSSFLFIPLALACFALVQNMQAVSPPPDGGYPGANTAEGTDALFSLTSGIANTAVGFNALHDNTTGTHNTAVGASALSSNTTGSFNMAIGTDALRDNNSNFNLAIGFRVLFLNTTGNHLTGIGAAALRNNTTGAFNTAIGADALRENTTGENNTVIGNAALTLNTTSGANVAVGDSALGSYNGLTVGIDGFNTALGSIALTALTEGFQNTAVGRRALESLTSGNNNTSVGWRSGDNLATGNNNTFLGRSAGANYTADESDNICIGGGTLGVTGDSNAIRIGTNLTSGGINVINNGPAANFIGIGPDLGSEGINILETLLGSAMSIGTGLPTVGSSTRIGGIVGNAQPSVGTVFDVSIETAAGGNFQRLGIDTSSRRYKEDIKPMDKLSEAIFKLKPVTYLIKKEINPAQPMAFGLIAEDVAEACPDLAAYWDGQPLGVHYKEVTVMLLNEFLKEHNKVEEQQASIADLKSTVALQQKEMQVLTAQLKEQAAQIQKVSAQLEASKPAPKVVANK
jgi:hypothetical protein